MLWSNAMICGISFLLLWGPVRPRTGAAVVDPSDWPQHEAHCVAAENEHYGFPLWQVPGVGCSHGRWTRLEAVDVVVAEVIRRRGFHYAALSDRDRGASKRRPGAIDPAKGSDSTRDVGPGRRRRGSGRDRGRWSSRGRGRD